MLSQSRILERTCRDSQIISIPTAQELRPLFLAITKTNFPPGTTTR